MTKLCPRYAKYTRKENFVCGPSEKKAKGARIQQQNMCGQKLQNPSECKKKMTKLCPRGPKPAKAMGGRIRKYNSSAYANAYAIEICAGKIKDPSGVKRKDFRGPKPSKAMGGRIRAAGGGLMAATERLRRQGYGKGGGVCIRGMNRDAVGKNS